MSDYHKRVAVLDITEATAFAEAQRKQGKTIVFTNGCFDLLHPGHLEILEKSREMGDCLFVGVNTDQSVARLKGPTRPIQPLVNRTAVLSSLRSVNCVVPFSDDTPLQLIKAIKPDILVKGGDYTVSQVVGADFVKKNGGRVEIVPILAGFSTTSIISKTTDG